MRAALILPFCLLACVGEPVDGTLPEGIYGSPDLALEIDATGAATFVRSCYVGELGVVTVKDGTLNATFDWVLIGGDAQPDTAEPYTEPATLAASVTTTRLWGTLETASGTQDIDLDWDEQPTYFECP